MPGKRTFEELNESGYDFFINDKFPRPFGFTNQILFTVEFGNVEYKDGILFASNVDKGVALSALIQSSKANGAQKIPLNVTYVDDAVSEVKNVYRSMVKDKMNHFIFQYLAPDREHFDY